MARRNIYETNYARLQELLGQQPEAIEPFTTYRLRSEGFMDFVVEKIDPCPHTKAPLLSLAHYKIVNGDLCQDPEVVVRIFPPGSEGFRELVPSTDTRLGRMEAFLFQQAIPPVFQTVYPHKDRYYPRLKQSLNSFLAFWLRNLKAQGFANTRHDRLGA